jgi:hypothetical protein
MFKPRPLSLPWPIVSLFYITYHDGTNGLTAPIAIGCDFSTWLHVSLLL